jgi:hypothetical protein
MQWKLPNMSRFALEKVGDQIVQLAREAHSEFQFTQGDKALLLGLTNGSAEISFEGRFDAHHDSSWQSAQILHPQLLRWICLNSDVKRLVNVTTITVQGAKFSDKTDFSDLTDPLIFEFTGCFFSGGLDLSNAKISRIQLQNCRSPWIFAESLVTNGDFIAKETVISNGGIDLNFARIGGNLTFKDSTSTADPKGSSQAFSAAVCKIDGDADLTDSTIKGEIVLPAARISGNLDLSGVQVLAGCGKVAQFQTISVNEVVFLNGFCASGTADFSHAEVLEDLDCGSDSRIDESKERGSCSANERPNTLTLRYSKLGRLIINENSFMTDLIVDDAKIGTIIIDNKDFSQSDVSFRRVVVGVFRDSTEPDHWPAKHNLHLDGLVYSRLDEDTADKKIQSILSKEKDDFVSRRLDWLSRDGDEPPQSYLQLASVLKSMGYEDGSTKVLERLEGIRRITHRSRLVATGEEVMEFPYAAVGFGYEPIRSCFGLAAVSAIGWVVYRRAYLARKIVPSEKDAYDDFTKRGILPEYYPRFSPLMYSIQNTFPLVDLGQSDKWQPDPAPSPKRAIGVHKPRQRLGKIIERVEETVKSSRSIRVLVWLQILLGWVLAAFFVAGVGDFIRH